MKVCYVLSTSEITGGANRSILDLLGALNRSKIEPIVLIKKHGDIEYELNRLKIPVYLVPFINEVSAGNPILDGMKRINAIKTTGQVVRFLKKHKVELVHNNSLPTLVGMEAAYKLGIPYVCHIREQIKSGLELQLLNEEKHFGIVRKSTGILAISEFVCEEYEEFLKGFPVIVLHDGVDISLYQNDEKTIFNGDLVNLAIYGNLDAQKGQMDAVRAVEILREKLNIPIKLYIIGNQKTEYADKVKQYVNSRGISNIVFMEPIRESESLKKSRDKMDINLVCSSAEGLGRVTIESMLSGCLTIGAKAGGTPEIIQDRVNGLMYECHNAEDLARTIEWAVANRNEAQRIARDGRVYAKENYNIVKYAMEIQNIYQALVQK